MLDTAEQLRFYRFWEARPYDIIDPGEMVSMTAKEFFVAQQLVLLPDVLESDEDLARDAFSHNGECPDAARVRLEERYEHLLEETDVFNRQLVSFQANKTEVLHSWFKYREGFSADLVEILLEDFGLGAGDTVFDPFAGSGTTLLVAQMLGINAEGVELLSHSALAWRAKSQVFAYDLDELSEIRSQLAQITPPSTSEAFPHLAITETAFPNSVERDLMAYTHWFASLPMSQSARTLCKLVLTSILERVSYTRKDGQYLRWDRRAEKIRQRNVKRVARGKKPIKGIHKGELPDVKTAALRAFDKILTDIATLQAEPVPSSGQTLHEGNTLYVLPELPADRYDGVITSPPYANRYDYTRTYALELAYLGVGEEIFTLRQRQLSCTVENRPKSDDLEVFYHTIGRGHDFERINGVIQSNAALAEIDAALQMRQERGDVNNRGILRMIHQYFAELTFVFAELCRVCRSGARVAFVNDNVRYAGEVIPVDLLSTNLAECVGFEPVKVYVLPQRKGNSSQQMGKFGREALRKSITIWRKP